MQPMINIDVPDLELACRFYGEALSLQVRRSLFDGTVIELAGAGLPIFLLEKPAGSIAAAAQSRNYGRHWTPVHLDVAVAISTWRWRARWTRGRCSKVTSTARNGAASRGSPIRSGMGSA
jgi:extradiol dioxygenase family protein